MKSIRMKYLDDRERSEHKIANQMRRAFHGHTPHPGLVECEYYDCWIRLARWYLRRTKKSHETHF